MELVKCAFREGHFDGNSNISSIREKVITNDKWVAYMENILIITLTLIKT